ncbi:MAG: hypothetical protein HYT39_04065 [Candidatus Sungbacteria bacterium]|nr:hypothetical protein [Candidatus Sungbacteria bacterium]
MPTTPEVLLLAAVVIGYFWFNVWYAKVSFGTLGEALNRGEMTIWELLLLVFWGVPVFIATLLWEEVMLRRPELTPPCVLSPDRGSVMTLESTSWARQEVRRIEIVCHAGVSLVFIAIWAVIFYRLNVLTGGALAKAAASIGNGLSLMLN